MKAKAGKKLFERGVSGDVNYRVVFACDKPVVSSEDLEKYPGLLFMHHHDRAENESLDRSISYWRRRADFDASKVVFEKQIQASGDPIKAGYVRNLKFPPEPLLSVLSKVAIGLAALAGAIGVLWTVFLHIFEEPDVTITFDAPAPRNFLRSAGVTVPIKLVSRGRRASATVSDFEAKLLPLRGLGDLSLVAGTVDSSADRTPILARAESVHKLKPWTDNPLMLEWHGDVKPGVYEVRLDAVASAGLVAGNKPLSTSLQEIRVLGSQPAVDLTVLRPLPNPLVARLYGQLIVGDALVNGVVCTFGVSDENITRLKILSNHDFSRNLDSLPGENRLRFRFDGDLASLSTFNLQFEIEQEKESDWSRLTDGDRIELGCSPR